MKKIIVFGLRGIPSVQGGVETHAENLYYNIKKISDYDITILCRKNYMKNKPDIWEGLKLLSLPAIKSKYLEAFTHSFLSSIYSLIKRPDIVHIHGIGPCFFSFLLKLFRLKIVFTYHSPNYKHKKWGIFAKLFLKFSERISLIFSDRVIFVSRSFMEEIKNKYPDFQNKFFYIPNGVIQKNIEKKEEILRKWDLVNTKYILSVGRITPEKAFEDLINAYKNLNLKNIKLVIVGDADIETDYSRWLKNYAKKNGIILTGFLKGEELDQIYKNASLFVISSHIEGLPIVLLEAMSFNLPIIASDILANLEVGLDNNSYYKCGNIEELAKKIYDFFYNNNKDYNYSHILNSHYNWLNIAKETIKLYETL